jgi:dTDP-4-amino-4,6-dideoxygalactose transaminase
MGSMPALLGGRPAFDPPLPFSRPTIEDRAALMKQIEEALESGRLTDGPTTRRLEEKVAGAFQVNHCVAAPRPRPV